MIYVTDRDDHVAVKFTLDGKPLMVLGTRGQPSDTGATKDIELPPRSAGPFNKPTEMVVAPSGDLYVSDGYRNSRVHRFSSQGALLDSWGKPGKQEPGEFHLPHSLWVDRQDQVYVCDRENSRIQVFTAARASSSPSGGTSTGPPTSTSTPRRSPTSASSDRRSACWRRPARCSPASRRPPRATASGSTRGETSISPRSGARTLTKYVRQR